MLSNNAESREYLMKSLYLVSEHTASYLCLWSIDLAVEEVYFKVLNLINVRNGRFLKQLLNNQL